MKPRIRRTNAFKFEGSPGNVFSIIGATSCAVLSATAIHIKATSRKYITRALQKKKKRLYFGKNWQHLAEQQSSGQQRNTQRQHTEH
jgi:hypothetical protein